MKNYKAFYTATAKTLNFCGFEAKCNTAKTHQGFELTVANVDDSGQQSIVAMIEQMQPDMQGMVNIRFI